jgi:vacuolar-type H+-ATPase subunit H
MKFILITLLVWLHVITITGNVVTDTLGSVKEKVKEGIFGKPETHLDKAKAKMGEAWEHTKDAAGLAGTHAQVKLEEHKRTVLEKASDFAESAKDTILETGKAALDKASEFVGSAKENVQEVAVNAKDTVLEKATDTKDFLDEKINGPRTLSGKAAAWVDEKINGPKTLTGQASKLATDAKEGVKETVTKAAHNTAEFLHEKLNV